MLTRDTLKRCMPDATDKNVDQYLGPLITTIDRFQINTPRRLAAFLAQLAHESGALRYNKELASGEAYEGRTDLGNKITGDGVRFKGRGLIQLTGRANYRAFTNDIGKEYDVDFEKTPEKVELPVFAALSAGWFWNSKGLNVLADQDDFLRISKRINGVNKSTGLPNGWEDRLKKYEVCKKVFGIV